MPMMTVHMVIQCHETCSRKCTHGQPALPVRGEVEGERGLAIRLLSAAVERWVWTPLSNIRHAIIRRFTCFGVDDWPGILFIRMLVVFTPYVKLARSRRWPSMVSHASYSGSGFTTWKGTPKNV
eukprot:356177-Chlamydomonas_euryale.AAC.5